MSNKYAAHLLILILFPLLADAQYDYSVPFDDHVIIRFSGYTVYADVLPDKSDRKANPDKTYYWNISDTLQSTRGAYSGKLLNGTYKEVFPDKNLKTTGQFRMGLKTGKWYHWYPGGELRKISIWRGGKENGLFRLYNPEGNLTQSGKYKEGILHGIIRTYVTADTALSSDAVSIVKYKEGREIKGWKGSFFSRTWQRIIGKSEEIEPTK